MQIQIFLVASTSVLYLIAAGMFSKSIWSFQYYVFAARVGSDVSEEGNGAGSYDILETVWHVDCCNPETDNGWDVFNAVLGWQNTATYGSVISYNIYWLFITFCVGCLLYEERTGSLSLQKATYDILLKIPGLKTYISKKIASKEANADQLVMAGQEQLRQDFVVQESKQTTTTSTAIYAWRSSYCVVSILRGERKGEREGERKGEGEGEGEGGNIECC
ncbi:high-affinity iron transporter protein [Rutstroemia sp. NJR-2017a BBW]|nr:high-affinity iron transporter protein [Rutstroemia sp. NJR-2017a BBW]